MNIGVVGVGVVGGACKFGFELLGHNVSVHDIVLDTTIDDVLDTEAVFICVPSPRADDGSCDVSIVEQVITDLKERDYKGILAIKSTVVPGTTESLAEKYPKMVLTSALFPSFFANVAQSQTLQRITMCVLLAVKMI